MKLLSPPLSALLLLEASQTAATPIQKQAADYSGEVIVGIRALNHFWYRNNSGLWDNAWWNSGNALTTIADYTLLQPQRAATIDTASTIRNTYIHAQQNNVATFKSQNYESGAVVTQDCINGAGSRCSPAKRAAQGFTNFLNDYYDDEGWWAMGLIHSYDATNNRDYLNAAANIFRDMQTGLGGPCDGGIYWSKDRNYVNAIANELYLTVAAALGNRIPDQRGHYIDVAKNQWEWFKNSGMINDDNLVNDGLTNDCRNNGRDTWTYNQGVILGGLAELYKATGNDDYINRADAIATAAMSKLVDDNGILIEANKCDVGKSECSHDLEQFKGIFIRNLGYLHQVAPQDAYKNFILRNADAVWSKNRNGNNKFGVAWDGPYFDASMMTDSSALDALVAAAAVA